ncbi:MAG TPA: hypothetical protein VJH70_00660 [Candidatus Paceibacterota bacterium]
MTIRIRRTLFLFLTCLFFIVGTILVFYSNGWRFDFETFTIDKLGALYIEASPEGASVKIEKTDFYIEPGILKNDILIANLFPKNYRIEISKDLYQTWNKIIAVQPSLVTKMYPIILLPKQPVSTLIEANTAISRIWIGPRFSLFQLNGKQLRLNNKIIPGAELHSWSNDGTGLLSLDKATNTWYVTFVQNQQLISTNLTRFLKNTRQEELLSAEFVDDKTRLIYISGKNTMYELDTNQFTLLPIQNQPVERFLTINKATLWLSQNTIFPTSPSLSHKDIIYNILKDKLPQQLNLAFAISPDQKKIALVNDYEPGRIRIYFLENDTIFNKKTGDFSILDLQRADNQFDFNWYQNSAYLILRLDNRLVLTEIDNNLPTNFQTIADNIRSYAYDQKNNAVYFIRPEDGVYKLDL